MFLTASNKQLISIHSLRMEGDVMLLSDRSAVFYFNPLPPHGGRQHAFRTSSSVTSFQSTPSAWRETFVDNIVLYRSGISIHSLRMEGDAR